MVAAPTGRNRSLWIRLLLTAGILAYLTSQIDMTTALGAVVRVSPTHLAAVLLLVAIDRAVMILRWILLLRAGGIRIETSRAVSIFLISSFVGSFLPAGVGGDLARAYGMSRATSATSEAIASVAVDRLLGITSLVIMGIIGLLLWTASEARETWVFAAVALLAVACVAMLWVDRVVRMFSADVFARTALGRRVMSTADAIGHYRSHTSTLVHVLGWSLVVQLLRVTQAYLLGLGLGIAVPFQYYVVFMPLGLLMLLLPVSVGGFGVPQGVIVWLLRPMGVADEASFALSTLIVLTGLAGNLPGLVLWVRGDREQGD